MRAFPGSTLMRNLLALAVLCVVATVYGLWLSSLPIVHVMPTYSLTLVGLYLVVVGVILARARRCPDERKGWVLLALGLLALTLANGFNAIRTTVAGDAAWTDWVGLPLAPISAGLQAWGMLSWPRREATWSTTPLHVMGSLLFGSSLCLLLGLMGLMGFGGTPTSVFTVRNLASILRVSIFGGTVIYLAGIDPRRLRGPLGWLLGTVATTVLALVAIRPLYGLATLQPHVTPLMAMVLIPGALLGLAAWLGGPTEPEGPPLGIPLAELATYVPYVAAGLILASLSLRREASVAWPLLGFFAITGLLVLRQFLLMRELRHANQGLEARVAERTQTLEHLQSILVRTERMNAMATLGAGLSHDMNNLLSAVRGAAELMKQDMDEGLQPAASDLQQISDAAAKAGDLSKRLMAFARQEQVWGQREPADLVEVLRGQTDLLRMLIGSRIRLDLDIAPDTPRVLVDPGLLEQILINLVSNAKDAMEGQGHIRIQVGPEVRDGTAAVRLAVEDSGPGIPEALQAKIFEPFFTTKPEGKGTGLGLASVKVLTAALGGCLDLRPGAGPGACFRIHLPVPMAEDPR